MVSLVLISPILFLSIVNNPEYNIDKCITNILHNINISFNVNSYVKAIVEYCCYAWFPMQGKNIDTIENIQRSFTRVFRKCGLPHMSYAERLTFLHHSTLEKRRLIVSLSMLYNIYNCHINCNTLCNFLTLPTGAV